MNVRKRNPLSLKERVARAPRVYLSAYLHQVFRTIAEIPFAIRTISAPEGEMVRDGEVTERGKIVRYSGNTDVILTPEGVMVWPNQEAGDIIRPLPHRG